jgi:hypothetical protein
MVLILLELGMRQRSTTKYNKDYVLVFTVPKSFSNSWKSMMLNYINEGNELSALGEES